nr:ligand-gated ion channel 50-like [Penaeus vannamei]
MGQERCTEDITISTGEFGEPRAEPVRRKRHRNVETVEKDGSSTSNRGKRDLRRSQNPLRFGQKVNAPFSCVMNLRNFPFDYPAMPSAPSASTPPARTSFLWDSLNVSYVGEVLLTEYEVGNVTVERQVDRDYSLAVISITFYRRFWFYVTSAYLPTVMLMMISYASLFIKRENDDLRVMMTLTTLLVLYALYQQISDGLPRTSYTKAVDVWCFFAITFIFTKRDVGLRRVYSLRPWSLGREFYLTYFCSFEKVIFHVLVDLQVKLRTARFRWMRSQGVTKGLWDDEENHSRRRVDMIKVAKILYAAVAVVFMVVYWVVVISGMET